MVDGEFLRKTQMLYIFIYIYIYIYIYILYIYTQCVYIYRERERERERERHSRRQLFDPISVTTGRAGKSSAQILVHPQM